MDKPALKPCPCGRIPDQVAVERDHDRSKWAYVVPTCCGEWSIEFRTGYKEDCEQAAIKAWNDAPRGT